MNLAQLSRMVPVKLGPPHAGLIVLFTREDYSKLWEDVDPEVCDQLERDVLGIREEKEDS